MMQPTDRPTEIRHDSHGHALVNMAHAFTPYRVNGRKCRVCGLIEYKLIHQVRECYGHGY